MAGGATRSISFRVKPCVSGDTAVGHCTGPIVLNLSSGWLGQCWAGWLMHNRHDLQAFVAISKVEAILNRTLELDESYNYAGPHLLLGAFYGGRSKLLGGKPDKARGHFDKCLELNQHKFLMAKVLYAKTYAVQMQDRTLFKKLLTEVMDAPADILPEQRLANAVAKQKAQKLLESADELF